MRYLENSAYPILIGQEPDKDLFYNTFISNHSSIHLLCDENTRKLCLPVLREIFPALVFEIIEIKAGESQKNYQTLEIIYRSLLNKNADRNALLINLGGGVIGDLGGFAAATYKRGIDFIQVPTTLLSMVDATVGGKLGYNFGAVKNSVGCFKNPKVVWINASFLKTLDKAQQISGWAEMLKHALISSKGLWEELVNFDIENEAVIPEAMIARSVEVKLNIVNKDPFEKGERKLLNLGHTLGHALESIALKQGHFLPHGHAVALGILGESFAAKEKGVLAAVDFQELKNYIWTLYGKEYPRSVDFQGILEQMKNDKKNIDQGFNFTLLHKIGHAEIDQSLNIKYIGRMLDALNQLS